MSPTDEPLEGDQRAATDGGAHLSDDQLFGQLAEEETVQLSNRERLERVLDAYVFAPGRVAWNDWRTRFGIFVITFFVLVGTAGTRIVESPGTNQAPVNHPPFVGGLGAFGEEGGWVDVSQASIGSASIPWLAFDAPLGASSYGEPIGRQLVHATPAMLEMVVAGAVVSIVLAAVIGITAGYKGGWTDSVLMSITDIVMTMPGLPLIIVIAAVWMPERPWVVGVVLAIDAWPGLARALRSQVLTIREESYVEASRAMGLSSRTIVGRDITPQLMPYILINASQAGRSVIFQSVALYFLGILPVTTANWGVMMDIAYTNGYALADLSNFYQIFFPMMAIVLLSFGLIMFSQGMDRVFNPRIRARHAKKVGGEKGEERLD